MCWLTDLNSRKPALGGAAETASRATVWNSVHRAFAGKLSGLSAASLKDARATGDPVISPGDSALSAERWFSPYLYPSGTRDRRSWALLQPVGYPKPLQKPPKRASEPVVDAAARHVRSRCLLSGP